MLQKIGAASQGRRKSTSPIRTVGRIGWSAVVTPVMALPPGRSRSFLVGDDNGLEFERVAQSVVV